jgi:hypothetical protein
MEFMGLLIRSLRQQNAIRTQTTLGDRSGYIGVSDIAKASDCLRAAVYAKTNASPHTLETLLRLNRGHWFEIGVAEAFRSSNVPFLHQLEIRISHNGIPVRAHLDFVFFEQSQEYITGIHVVECKSCGHIPETAYAAHEMQIYGQIGLLHSYLDQPCFFLLGDGIESMTFASLLKKRYGAILPKNSGHTVITGSILCLSMNDAVVFGPYSPNAVMLDACLNLGEHIRNYADALRSGRVGLNEVPTVKGYHPLCDYCEINGDCPRFTGIPAPQLEEELLDLRDLKLEREILNRRIRALEEGLKTTARHISPNGDWINAVTQRFRLGICEGRKILDKDMLASALVSRLPGETAESVMQAGMKTGESYERLHFGNMNNKEK